MRGCCGWSVASVVSIDFAIQFVYAMVGSQVMRLLKRRGALWLDRVCGAVLLGLAASLAFARRATVVRVGGSGAGFCKGLLKTIRENVYSEARLSYDRPRRQAQRSESAWHRSAWNG